VCLASVLQVSPSPLLELTIFSGVFCVLCLVLRNKHVMLCANLCTRSRARSEHNTNPQFQFYTGRFKKKVTLSHVYNKVTSEPPQQWSHFVTRSPLVAASRNTCPRQLQINFDIFPSNCCISRDFRLTGYLIINM
jgi:hypothetical protein